MQFTVPDYTYRVKEVVKVVDGDTVDVIIDLGFHINVLKRIRFSRIDTYELRGGTDETKSLARDARDRVIDLLSGPNKTIYIRTEMDETGKYGRLLGTLFVLDQQEDILTNVSDVLLEEGYVESVSP